MSKEFNTESFKLYKYKEIESRILSFDIERKVIFIYFFKKNGILTKSMQIELESSYYKILSINEDIIKISPNKYGELIAHVLMNTICNSYSPNVGDLRLLNGMFIYACQKKRPILIILLSLILQNYDGLFKFNNLKYGIKFEDELLNIFRLLNIEPSHSYEENKIDNIRDEYIKFPKMKEIEASEMKNCKFNDENQMTKKEKIVEMEEALIELEEQLIELEELEIERFESRVE